MWGAYPILNRANKKKKKKMEGLLMDKKRLYKTEGPYKMVCGVCGGIAEYFDIDPTLVRVGWVILTLCGTVGFWAYVACALIMPNKSDVYPGY